MTTLVHDLFRPREAHQANARQAARHAAHVHHQLREAARRELELEVRGLLMAARVHGFHIAIEGGRPVVSEFVE